VLKKSINRLVIFTLVCLIALSSVAQLMPAKAAEFDMQTGYYVGTGVTGKAVSGLGFQPDLVIIKAATAAGVAVFKSSAMPANATAFMSATANNTASNITFNADGFTLGTLANVNMANVIYTWTAFYGSDCSASGNFCVGTYTGNGVNPQTITTGFQPSAVIVKRSTAVAANFRTASMATDRTEFFTSTAADTAGAYIRSFASTSFDVGSTNNAALGTYYYIAFKSGSSAFAEGTYTGDSTDGRNITGVGFQPNLVIVKNSTSATTINRRAVMSGDQHYGDHASYTGDNVANAVNMIQEMQSGGFQVGSGANTNESTFVHYWMAFGGAPDMPAGSGTFTMDQGTYTGTGSTFSVTGLSFSPDLVLIKGDGTNYAVFRIKQMAGDATAYMSNAVADFTGGITSINSDGFSIGTNAEVNTSSNTYRWQAFGNAYKSDTESGASDFAIGTYHGNSVDDRDIEALPFQPDLVVVKRNSTNAATFKTTDQAGDLSGFFAATIESTNVIQSLNSNGFQVGNGGNSNASAGNYRWFAFKSGLGFDEGSYTGDSVFDRQVTTSFAPEYVWVKRSIAVEGVQRPTTLAGDSTQFFTNTANNTGRIRALNGSGFTVGTQTEVNSSGGTYRYMIWREPVEGVLSTDIVDSAGDPVAVPSFALTSLGYLYECTENTGTLGTSNQKIRISNMTSTPTWTTSIAPTDGETALWRNGGNTEQFDFNDPTGTPNGCSDGADSDSKAGKLELESSTATVTPQSGCTNDNLSLGADQSFSEGSVATITMISASSGADIGCYWDITDIPIRQYIPSGQPGGSYNINLTITTVAS
jgi:hypothetical protein